MRLQAEGGSLKGRIQGQSHRRSLARSQRKRIAVPPLPSYGEHAIDPGYTRWEKDQLEEELHQHHGHQHRALPGPPSGLAS